MIKAIIFDLWGTLFYENVKGKHPLKIFAEKIGQNFEDYNYLKIFEKHLMLKKHYNLEIPVRLLLEEFNIKPTNRLMSVLVELLKKKRFSQKPYPEVMRVLKEIKKQGYRIGLITNTYYYAYKMLNEKFKIESLFDVILKSYEVGILKPNPKIFKIMLKKLKIEPSKSLMVGNSLKDDIKPAERLGIKGILIDRENRYPSYKNRITSLRELWKFL